MNVVIFSTTLFEQDKDEWLFSLATETKFTEELSSFFLRNRIDIILKSNATKESLKKLLLDHCKKHISELNSLATENDKENHNQSGVQLSEAIENQIETEIGFCNDYKDDILKRIIKWNLKNEVLKIGTADTRSLLKKLNNQNVYAIESLKDFEENREWIPSLIKCAKEIKGEVGDDVNLFLVLHDKDVKEYEGKNAYVCSGEEVKSLAGNDAFNDVHIAFFSHTANKFVDILDNSAERDILPEVEHAFIYYKEFQKLIERSNNCLNNMMGQNPSTIIQNEDELVASSVNNPRLADDSAEQGAYEVKVTTLSTEIGGNEVKTNDWLKELIKINKELEKYE